MTTTATTTTATTTTATTTATQISGRDAAHKTGPCAGIRTSSVTRAAFRLATNPMLTGTGNVTGVATSAPRARANVSA
jgi:hypothetical protein